MIVAHVGGVDVRIQQSGAARLTAECRFGGNCRKGREEVGHDRAIGACRSRDRGVEVATGERLYTLSEPQDGINTIAIDPTGKLVAAGGLDKSIRIWSLGEKEGKLLHSQIAHEDAILRLAWSPDGAELVSSSADRTVKVFSSKDLSELHSFPEPDWVYGLQFAPNGKTFAIGRFDGSLTITP